jgi:DNA-binding NarL/FixJ family response regulator
MGNASVLRILLADDHEVIRRGLRQLIEQHDGWDVCGEAATGREAIDQAMALKPDVVVLDLSMPGLEAFDLVRGMKSAAPGAELLVFTMHEGEEIMRDLIGCGARGYVLKSDSTMELVAAIKALAEHKPFFTRRASVMLRDTFVETVAHDAERSPLSARERHIIQLLAEGRRSKEAARLLGISTKTVESHRTTIMRKLGIKSVVELVHYAVRNKIIVP